MGLWAHSGSTQGNMTANEVQGDEGRESRYMKTIVIDKTEKFHYIVITVKHLILGSLALEL